MLQLKIFKGGYDGNFSYVLFDNETKEAGIIDTSIEPSIILQFIQEKGLTLKFAIIMHSHFDHVVGYEEYKKRKIPLAASEHFKNVVDIQLQDNGELVLGSSKLKVVYTPGHIYDSICVLTENKLFTSDTLFIDGCGRCDLEGADINQMYDSLERIKKLPDETLIYPGHDYGDTPFDTLDNQKKTNHFLTAQTKDEFIQERRGLMR